jgi:tetratricopeptide (TPR) repeat protein
VFFPYCEWPISMDHLTRLVARLPFGGASLRKAGFRATLCALALAGSFSVAVSAAPAERPTPAIGASGLFLAGAVANAQRDTAAAAEYFREALKADPRNAGLLDQAFLAELVDGNLDAAFALAERSIKRDRSNALAHVALGVRALKTKQYDRARRSFDRAGGTVRNPDLTIALLRGWAQVGAGKTVTALKSLDSFTDKEQLGYRDFISGLMADLGKRNADAETRLARAFNSEPGVLRVTDAYARVLSRRNRFADARRIVTEWRQKNPTQPFLADQLAAYDKGLSQPSLVSDVAGGAAEVFYGLGAIASPVRDTMTSVIYLQLAHYLAPKDDLITMTLAEYFEQLRQNERAAEIYQTIPATSPLANRAAIGRATALERMERSDEAISVLRSLLIATPGDMEAADTLGSILRSKKRWVESTEVYDAAIKALGVVEQRHWVFYFGRAIGYERSKQWDKAEKDFQSALDLLPLKPRTAREGAERAQVLNYLAYSWADMHKNVEKAFDMLREAVALSPGDGAIVDSLGWAYYRLGRYDDALRELERAVLLKSGDPTINDHLGDVYWKVGRKREANFKWSQTLTLNPDPEQEKAVRLKLETGLEEGPAANAGAPKPNGG